MTERIATFLLAVVVAAYWYRVARMAYKQRRKTGRAANFIPREPVGRVLRLIWNPIVALWIILPLLATCIVSPPWILAPVFDVRLVALPGALLASACFLATLVCWQKMGSSWRMGIDPNEKTTLVVSGPYAYVRHPIYGLSMLMMAASMLTLPSPLMLLIGFTHILLLFWESRREEKHLLRVHGDAYRRYMNHSGRFLPRFSSPYVPSNDDTSVPEPMRGSRKLNVFQQLMRWWDQAHPYNAMQLVRLAGAADAPFLRRAWADTLRQAGLGRVTFSGRRYVFQPIPAGEEPSINVLDPDIDLHAHISEEMNQPFRDHEIPARLFVQQQDGSFVIGLTYGHWLADSHSIRSLMLNLLSRFEYLNLSPEPLKPAAGGYWRHFSPAQARWDFIDALLHLARSFCQFRLTMKVSSEGLDRPQVRVVRLDTENLSIRALQRYARRHGVKVNDVLMATLAETAYRLVPLQQRKNRVRLAIGNVVDLRRMSLRNIHNKFGLFLGLTHINVDTRSEVQDWDRLLSSVARQNRHTNVHRLAPASLLRMAAACFAGFFSNVEEMYHFYRKEMPLAGGVSNVHLHGTPIEELARSGQILEYRRISPTGPMVPLALAVTTLGRDVDLVLTYRQSLIDDALAERIGESLLARLQDLADSSQAITLDPERIAQPRLESRLSAG